MCINRVTALALLIGVFCAFTATADNDRFNKDVFSLRPSLRDPAVTVFKNGLADEWSTHCPDGSVVNVLDMSQLRIESTSSLGVAISPGQSFALQSQEPISSNSVLDFWAKGPGVRQTSIQFEDLGSHGRLREVELAHPTMVHDGAAVPFDFVDNEDGWTRIQIKLYLLISAADETGTDEPSFNRIIFKDLTGEGLWLMLDDIKLVHPIEASTPELITTSTLEAVDLTGRRSSLYLPDDVPSQSPVESLEDPPTANQYIMKMRRGTTEADLHAICNELGGTALPTGTQRFSGTCQDIVEQVELTDSLLTWRYATVLVKSMDDIEVMREVLVSKVEYFERDQPVQVPDRKPPPMEGIRTDAEVQDIEGDKEVQGIGTHEEVQEIGGSKEVQDIETDEKVQHAEGEEEAENSDLLLTPQYSAVQRTTSSPHSSTQGRVTSYLGLDRIDQRSLPLDNTINTGDLNGAGVHIFVLDTGVRRDHTAFTGRIGEGYSVLTTDDEDRRGHGTHCSATALGASQGVAPGAILHPVKVFNDNGGGTLITLMIGLRWVQQYVRRNGLPSAVVSMSLTANSRSQAIKDLVDELANQDRIVSVTAAGNQQTDACNYVPGSANTAVNVGATIPLSDQIARYSNRGRCLALHAPGSDILSAGISGPSAEVALSGTSHAAPHVAGAAALLLQARPTMTPLEVKAALQQAATRISLSSSSSYLLLNVNADNLRAASGLSAGGLRLQQVQEDNVLATGPTSVADDHESELSVWDQCGGMDGDCEPNCGDLAWPHKHCPDNTKCVRFNEDYWQCRQ